MTAVKRCEDLQVGQGQHAAAAVPASQASRGGGRRMCFAVSWWREGGGAAFLEGLMTAGPGLGQPE